MSTTTLDKTDTAPAPGPGTAPRRRVRRRGERGPLGTALLHGGLVLAGLVALAPVAWLCYLSLGPDKEDYLHPS
ncbi:ABC transporter permease, partial [Streptomyces sp. SID2955]|nr:ABC transporter permease [Streptomyces sp. SID2955]